MNGSVSNLDIGPVPGLAHASGRQPPRRLGAQLRKVQRLRALVADDEPRQHRQHLPALHRTLSDTQHTLIFWVQTNVIALEAASATGPAPVAQQPISSSHLPRTLVLWKIAGPTRLLTLNS